MRRTPSAWLALPLLILSLTLPLPTRAGGNGSGSVGNGITIDDSLAAMLPEGSVRVEHDQVVDGQTGEPLLQLRRTRESALRKQGSRISRSRLGYVDGYEYVPGIHDSSRRNFWATCSKDGDCLKLEPLTRGNPKALSVIGSLKRR